MGYSFSSSLTLKKTAKYVKHLTVISGWRVIKKKYFPRRKILIDLIGASLKLRGKIFTV